MQLRNLGVFVGFIGLFYSSLTLALGLGEISLKSSYNEPLRAEIRLLQVRDLSKEEILVALASREDFKRVGLDRFFFLTDLKYDVILTNPSYPYIKVTSSKPVQEPYLNFLLDVQWPSGRLLREYTLLLDLPVFAKNKSAAPVSSPRAAASPSAPRPIVRPSPVRSSSAPAPSSSFSSNPPDSYRVQSGDTMWEIAQQLRPDSSVTVSQTMIAIQALNPDAFINGNINLLRKGQVLRTPTVSEIQNTNYNDAVTSIKQQTQAWSKKPQKAALSAVSPTSTQSTSAKQEGRLTLGSANNADTSSAVKGSGASGSGESLQNELAIAQEELDKASRENSDLNARVKELEEQIKTMESLAKLTNDQLKALELATAKKEAEGLQDAPIAETAVDGIKDAAEGIVDGATESVDNAVEEITSIETPVEEAVVGAIESGEALADEGIEAIENVVEGSTEIVDPVQTEVVVEETPAPETPELVTPEPVTPEVATPDRGLIGFIMDNMVAFAGGLIALLLAALFAIKRFASKDDEDFEEFDFDSEISEFDEELEPDLDDFDESLDTVDLDDLEDDHGPVEAKTEDPVAEADIFLSLGQSDKAEALLQTEINQNPGNAAARLALLKIFSKAQNASAFDDQYAQLLPLGDADANHQAKSLRDNIEGVTDFDVDSYSLDETLPDADDLDLDLDLDFDGDDDFLSDAEIGSDNLLDSADELSSDLSSEADELSLDLDESLSDELMDLDDDLVDMKDNSSLDELEDNFIADLDIDDELDIDLNMDGELDTELADDLDLELDLDVDSAAELNALVSDVPEVVKESSDTVIKEAKDFDLDLPPGELDIESLDQEIDAMTSALDDDLDFDSKDESVEEMQEELVGELPLEEEAISLTDELPVMDDPEDLTTDNVVDISDELEISGDSIALDDDIEGLDDELDDEPVVPESEEEKLSYSLGETAENPDEVLIDGSQHADELDFLDDNDEVTTKLDLARAYIDMGDNEGAEDILQEVLEEGNAEQKKDAEGLLKSL